jgi:hypothetical protein
MRYWLAVIAIVAACGGGGDHGRAVPVEWRAVRESPGHVAHLASAGLACRDCHDSDRVFAKPPDDLCTTKCHEQVETPLHQVRASDPTANHPPACKDCHGFGVGARASPWQCMDCHQHDQGAVIHAVGAHAAEACGQCHRPHQSPSLTPKACTDCHADAAGHHGRTALSGTTGCLDCHAVHEARNAAAEQCAVCHATQPHPIDARARFPGHDQCTSCHQPHEFVAKAVRACTDCHQAKPVLAAAQHATCVSCHQPHLAAAPRACASCHRDERVAHPPTTEGTCAGCHPPHTRLAGGALAVECATCHADRVHGDAAPGPECRSCHTPHGPTPIAEPRLCAKCHADQTASTAATGHAACASCHVRPGHAAQQSPRACASCHAPIAARVRVGHDTCTNCHTGGPHAPAAPVVACATCHAEPARTAPVGHRACATCHDPHSGSVRPSASTCASCHAAPAARGHGPKLACATCHQPHAGAPGPSTPPACVTCHPAATRPALHRSPGHARCEACHQSHELAPRADRATCLTCHTDRTTHEPTARTCAGQRASQLGAVIGMREVDQRLAALAQRQAVEVARAVLGDHPVDVAAGGDHAGAGLELGGDARHRAPAAVDGSAMIGLPPRETAAPRRKSIWPPMPEKMRWPSESAHTWPVRSISSAELIAVTLSFLRMSAVSLVRSQPWNSTSRVVVDEVVEALRAVDEAGDGAAGVHGLLGGW